MRYQPAPRLATWILQRFCANGDDEPVIGDLLEQHARGRGRLWYWRQVLYIVFLGISGRITRRPLRSTNRGPVRLAFAAIPLVGALSAVLLSDIWPILLFCIVGGCLSGVLIFGYHNSPTRRAEVDSPGIAPNRSACMHPGISISRIPIEGAVGLIFVIGTAFIFGFGVPAIRQVLVVTYPWV